MSSSAVHLSAVPCQDVPSFGRKQVLCCVMSSSAVKMPHLSAVPCQDVPSHLSARSMLCVVLCPQVLSRCPIFRQYPPIFWQEACCVLYYVLKCCQDAPSFGSTLSRCPIFWQYPVKMPHLLAVPCQDVPSHLSARSMLCVVLCPASNFLML